MLREKFGDSALDMQQPEDDMNVQTSADINDGSVKKDGKPAVKSMLGSLLSSLI